MKTHLIWLCVSAAALLAGMQLVRPEAPVPPRPVRVAKPKVVVAEKPPEVVPVAAAKETEPAAEAPAPTKIPVQYENALAFLNRFTASKFVTAKQALAGVKTVSVGVFLSEDIKKIVTEAEIRAAFEGSLKGQGIQLEEKSRYSLVLSEDGFTRDSPVLTYHFAVDLYELLYAFRDDGAVNRSSSSIWDKGNFGTVPLAQAREILLAQAESAGVRFAKDWLAVNPTKDSVAAPRDH